MLAPVRDAHIGRHIICPPPPSSKDSGNTNFSPLKAFFEDYVMAIDAEDVLCEGLKARGSAFLSLVCLGMRTETRLALHSGVGCSGGS